MKFKFIISFIFFANTFAQTPISISNFIDKIEQESLSYKSKTNDFQKENNPPIAFHQKYFDGTITNYKVSNVLNGSFSVSQKENSKSLFYFTKRNGSVKGVLLDTTKSKGYIIRSKNGVVSFTETPKSKLIYNCPFDKNQAPASDIALPPTQPAPSFIGNSNISNVLKLESKPGSPNVVYLDFDGEPIIPGWSRAYKTSNISNEKIRKIWESVSENFIAFDVNITTNRTLFDQTPLVNKGWVVLADFLSNDWSGRANYDTFGTKYPALINAGPTGTPTYYNIESVTSHEIAHTLGLSHDPAPDGTSEYYYGHGEWAPIMGGGGHGGRTVSHWSKGEYTNASNTEDDIEIMGRWLGFRSDDYPKHQNLFVELNDSALTRNNFGIIESQTDVDTFKLELIANGLVEFEINSSISNTNLDILVKVFDENLKQLSSYNPIGQRHVNVSENLTAGVYFMTIEGDGELTVDDGFSDYSSFGYYQIKGKIENHKIEDVDLIAVSMENGMNNCNKVYTPKVTLMNNGSSKINSFNIDVYIDNILNHTETHNTSILSGATTTIALNDIMKYGTHTIKLVLSLPDNSETALYNNEIESSYSLQDGNIIQFATDLSIFNQTTPFSWEIINASSTEAINSSSHPTLPVNGAVTQDFCLSRGCYDFNVVGNYTSCTSNPIYKSTQNYNTGDKVQYQEKLYAAKWWTVNAAPDNGGAWSLLGDCIPLPYEVSLKVLHNNSVLLTENSSVFGGSLQKNFCFESEATTENKINSITKSEIILQNGLLEIPASFVGGFIKLLNASGQIIYANKINKTSLVTGGVFPKGTYFVKIEKGFQRTSQFIFVK